MTAALTTTPDLTALSALVAGRVLRPGDPDFALLATPWNVAHADEPLAVVAAAGADDVAAVISHLRGTGIDVGVQATGHGAVGFTRPTVLVHTGQLADVVVDAGGHARVGAGARWQQVLDAASLRGFAAPAGSAPGVGVVGYLTGGGLSPIARTVGLASDLVTAFEVVTGDGVIRRVTPTEHCDLFWGLRGGKGTLGIVTAVELDLPRVSSFTGGCLYYAGHDAAVVVHAWARWSRDLPREASTSLAVLRLPPLPAVPPPLAGTVSVAVRFAWCGDPAEAQRVVAPMRAAADVVLGGVGPMSCADLGAIHNDPVDPMPVHEAAVVLQELPDAAVDAFLGQVGPTVECPQVIVELRRLGGAVADLPTVPSAVCHRDAAYHLLAIGIAAPPALAGTTAHARALLEHLAPWSGSGRFPNFGASADPAEVARAYDAPTLRRLAALARRHDPDTVLAASRPVLAAAARSAAETVG